MSQGSFTDEESDPGTGRYPDGGSGGGGGDGMGEASGASLAETLAELSRLSAQGTPRVRLSGCQGSLLAQVVAHLSSLRAHGGASGGPGRGRQPPLLVVARDGNAAAELARDLQFFLPELPASAGGDDPTRPPRVMLLPELENSPWADVSPDRRAILRRMATLFRLSQGLAGEVLVTSPSGLGRRVPPREGFGGLVDVLQAEQDFDRAGTLDLLVRGGYTRTPVVEDPGTFAVRGGVIDLYVPLYRFPVRLELFGDLVESIRFFDPETQRTLRSATEIFIHPVRETVQTHALGSGTLRQRLLEAADHAAHPSTKTRAILEQIEAGEDFFGIEALTPAFHEKMEPLSAYLGPGTRVVVDEPESVLAELEEELATGDEAYHHRLEEHRIAFAPSDFYLSVNELRAELGRGQVVESRALSFHEKDDIPSLTVRADSNADLGAELRNALHEKHEELLRPLVRRMEDWRDEGTRVVLVTPSLTHGERLESLLRGYGLRPVFHRTVEDPRLASGDGATRAPGIELRVGPLHHGFRLPHDHVAVVTESEIFGEKATRRVSKQKKPTVGDVDSFKELAEGAYVVHKLHGIGVYKGLVKLPVGNRGAAGANVDFLHLEYEGGALYLPVWRLDEVQRYVGAEGLKPRLDKLGGLSWSKVKSKVSKEIQKLAEDLLQIYAQRKALPGHGFRLDAHGEQSFAEFEGTFAFEETVDQQKAIDAVLEDMEQERPMDRLVCGDVGYGKTEVALRAAMKAVLGGKQVAVLAPTTVLVEQHAMVFAERFKDFPVKVESISRFKEKSEQTQVVRGLAEGKVDVVIGTHRLLSSDVRFKDLGLIVIDEEQRFGVSHKERLRSLRTQVDVLTMTATPIPRTLHMALMGLREISIITTPPADRLAVRTLLARYDDAILVEGIKRELARGGQMFFVHNRVESIHKWSAKIRELMPEVRVCVGHGQMPPEELEKVMIDFVDGKYDVLVCTTIIESGLDISRANTMFVDRADTFGLAQLYQLRGRIGRSKERAYCYLFVPPEAALSSDAKQRLTVLQRYTELGAGFQIASHDLEIRGAGDLLGAKQSGSIAAVGFEMYTALLEEAVAELKGEAIRRERDPELSCDLPGYIPDDYLPDTAQRLDFYKRMSSAHDEEEVGAIVAELNDRYGEAPPEVGILADIMVVKGFGRRLGATAIELSEARLALALAEDTPLRPEQVMRLVNEKRSPWRLTPDMRLSRSFQHAEKEDRLRLSKSLLAELLRATK